MYDDEFEETLTTDEGDTLEFERSWYKRRPRRLRTPSPTVTPEAYAATAAAWDMGRAKTMRRSTERQVAHKSSKVDVLFHDRTRELQRISKLEESIMRSEEKIAQIARRREEYKRESAAVATELETIA